MNIDVSDGIQWKDVYDVRMRQEIFLELKRFEILIEERGYKISNGQGWMSSSLLKMRWYLEDIQQI